MFGPETWRGGGGVDMQTFLDSHSEGRRRRGVVSFHVNIGRGKGLGGSA